jgi:mannose-6-phosphate isomerase-like protein (cupin superfamily)
MSVFNIEDEVMDNEFYLNVLHTDEYQQIVAMSLKPGQEIGFETHEDTSQFIRIEQGEGIAVLDDVEYEIYEGDAVVIPAGTEHNIVSTGKVPLKFYTLYSGEILHNPTQVQQNPN